MKCTIIDVLAIEWVILRCWRVALSCLFLIEYCQHCEFHQLGYNYKREGQYCLREVLKMSVINKVESAILSLDGGKYQKLMDAYLMRKYQFSNINPLGVQTGTDKTTKGTPDSYVECDNGQYIIIMYGSVEAASFSKLKSDILSCFNESKLSIPIDKIDRIICAYTSTNLHIEQLEALKKLIEGVKIELIGLGTVAHDIVLKYRFLAERFLDIPVDSGQVLDIEEFVEQYDAGGMNAPLGLEFVSREDEIQNLKEKITNNDLVIVSGASGIGKTKLVLEASKQMRSEHGMNIVCVKNNGQLLYNDVRETINEPGTYLLFLDDANHAMNLESIFEFCISKKVDSEVNVKIIMTVRDYAKESIKKLALNKAQFEEVELKPLSIEDIQSILRDKLEIKNEHYLKQIVKIAKGNIRLAVLAAIAAKENGFPAINDATDIFHNFYDSIFAENKITESEMVVLLAVAIFGPVMLESHDGIQYIMASNNISDTEYINICHLLNDCELLDLYEESVVKISDQSFANYILQYALIEKKRISIKKLLLGTFPKYSSKLIYAINTVIQLFNSNTTLEYIEHEINEAWEQCCACDEGEYVKAFRVVNEEKALLYAKRIIDETENVLHDLDAIKFPREINSVYENDEVVQILTDFGQSEQYRTAVDLLLVYFSKRPDVGKEICYGIIERMGIDIHSNECNHDRERYLISQLYKRYQESGNNNFAILLICVIKKFLAYEFHKTEQGMSPNTVTRITYHLKYSEELMEYRKELWQYLKELREEVLLQEAVDGVITSLYTGENEEAKKIFFEDVSILHQLYDDGDYIPDLDLCAAFAELVGHMHWLEQDTSIIERFLGRNVEYSVYRVLIREHVKGEDWREEEKNRKLEIEQLIADYDYEDFLFLFNVCKKRETTQQARNDWCLQRSIEFVFEFVQADSEKYQLAMKAYFASGTPYLFRANDKIVNLLKLVNVDDIRVMIEGLDLVNQMKWTVAFYEELPEEEISIDIVNDMVSFIKGQLEADNVQIPNIYCLPKYKDKGIDIIAVITDFLLKVGEKKPYIVADFFERVFDEEKVEEILDFFEGDTEKILKLYLIAMENNHFDYNGSLLLRLIQIDIRYWNEITKKCGEDRECNIDNRIFFKIWSMDNYHELIDIAYLNMRSAYFCYLSHDTIIHIFDSPEKTKPLIMERKEAWIREYINEYAYDELKMIDIFDVIATALPTKRIDFVKIFLEKNSKFDMFKKIPLFPSSRSWSGSEIPLIEKDISFLQTLLDEILGVDYLEHRLYLKERINSKKQYKQNVLKQEYMENFAYV